MLRHFIVYITDCVYYLLFAKYILSFLELLYAHQVCYFVNSVSLTERITLANLVCLSLGFRHYSFPWLTGAQFHL